MKTSQSIKRVFIPLLAAIMAFSVLSVSGFAGNTITSAQANSNAQTIFDFLVNDMSLNSAAACGVLANIECESDFNPTLYGDGGSSYGICQWNGSRFTNLRNYCNNNGYSWSSLNGQLNYLRYELTYNKSDTGYILDRLIVDNTAAGAYTAGYNWCYYFERPANKAVKSENRGNMAKDEYWPEYKIVYSLGDINNDGKINSADSLMAIEHSVGKRILTPSQFMAADVNSNKKVNSDDALIILSISAGSDKISNYQ